MCLGKGGAGLSFCSSDSSVSVVAVSDACWPSHLWLNPQISCDDPLLEKESVCAAARMLGFFLGWSGGVAARAMLACFLDVAAVGCWGDEVDGPVFVKDVEGEDVDIFLSGWAELLAAGTLPRDCVKVPVELAFVFLTADGVVVFIDESCFVGKFATGLVEPVVGVLVDFPGGELGCELILIGDGTAGREAFGRIGAGFIAFAALLAALVLLIDFFGAVTLAALAVLVAVGTFFGVGIFSLCWRAS